MKPVWIAVILMLALSACNRSPIPSASDAERQGKAPAPEAAKPAGTASVPDAVTSDKARFAQVNTADVRAAPQLLAGWHQIEDGSWRWMAREGRAVLAAPSSASNFELRFFLPEAHLQRIGGTVSVAILLDGKPLTEEHFSKPGLYTMRRPVPAGAITSPTVNVVIRLNRAAPPTDTDKRELGIVVHGFGFVP